MKNRDFIELLRAEKDAGGQPYTVEKLADSIFSERSHVNAVLRNRSRKDKPNYGAQTRRKLAKFFAANFATAPAMLAILGWDASGNVGRPTFHVEQGGENG